MYLIQYYQNIYEMYIVWILKIKIDVQSNLPASDNLIL